MLTKDELKVRWLHILTEQPDAKVWKPRFETIKTAPEDPRHAWWWRMGKARGDWYMLIIKDGVSQMDYPVYVRQFGDLNLAFYKDNDQNDQKVTAIYMLAT